MFWQIINQKMLITTILVIPKADFLFLNLCICICFRLLLLFFPLFLHLSTLTWGSWLLLPQDSSIHVVQEIINVLWHRIVVTAPYLEVDSTQNWILNFKNLCCYEHFGRYEKLYQSWCSLFYISGVNFHSDLHSRCASIPVYSIALSNWHVFKIHVIFKTLSFVWHPFKLRFLW